VLHLPSSLGRVETEDGPPWSRGGRGSGIPGRLTRRPSCATGLMECSSSSRRMVPHGGLPSGDASPLDWLVMAASRCDFAIRELLYGSPILDSQSRSPGSGAGIKRPAGIVIPVIASAPNGFTGRASRPGSGYDSIGQSPSPFSGRSCADLGRPSVNRPPGSRDPCRTLRTPRMTDRRTDSPVDLLPLARGRTGTDGRREPVTFGGSGVWTDPHRAGDVHRQAARETVPFACPLHHPGLR
jgi:hypothetical protein